MNSEEFHNQIEQVLIKDIKRRNEERDKIAEIMEYMPAIPFKDMEPLFRIPFQLLWSLERMVILYYQPELAMEHMVMMKQLYELGKVKGYESINAILASSPFYFLGRVFLLLLV